MEKPVDLSWRKSSHSANGGSDCVEVGAWRKSTYSGNGGGECVEAGHIPGAVVVRDTKYHDGGTLAFSAEAWGAFTASLK